MTHVMLAWLGPAAAGADFCLALANALGLYGIRADAAAGRTRTIWLGLLPEPDSDDSRPWSVATWAPSSVGPSFHLAAALQAGLFAWATAKAAQRPQFACRDGGVILQLPPAASDVTPARGTVLQVVVSLPNLRFRSLPARAGRELAQAMANVIARQLGVANAVTMSRPAVATAPAQPEPASPANAAAPRTEPAPALPAVDDTSTSSGDARPRDARSRAERGRDGRQGSRTYEHPPWPTSDRLQP